MYQCQVTTDVLCVRRLVFFSVCHCQVKTGDLCAVCCVIKQDIFFHIRIPTLLIFNIASFNFVAVCLFVCS